MVQTLVLDEVDDAAQLFRDLGGELDSPASFCARVRQLSNATAVAATLEQIKAAQQSLGSAIGAPPKLLSRRMLDVGGLTEAEMVEALKADPANYVSSPVAVRRMLDV